LSGGLVANTGRTPGGFVRYAAQLEVKEGCVRVDGADGRRDGDVIVVEK